ncbi:MAG TPA: hypothetical protein VFQ53_28365 [Kofleriaceae bacterium]|nr:hypothetical protein [Kofleriaceae bacterium]
MTPHGRHALALAAFALASCGTNAEDQRLCAIGAATRGELAPPHDHDLELAIEARIAALPPRHADGETPIHRRAVELREALVSVRAQRRRFRHALLDGDDARIEREAEILVHERTHLTLTLDELDARCR